MSRGDALLDWQKPQDMSSIAYPRAQIVHFYSQNRGSREIVLRVCVCVCMKESGGRNSSVSEVNPDQQRLRVEGLPSKLLHCHSAIASTSETAALLYPAITCWSCRLL